MASKKRTLEDVLENMKTILDKQENLNEEIKAEKGKIYKKYKSSFENLETVKKLTDELIRSVRQTMIAEQEKSTREIRKDIGVSNVVPEIAEDLKLVLKGQRIIYPENCKNDGCLACCVSAMLDDDESDDELTHSFEYFGVPEENRKEFRSLVKETLTIDEKEATIAMRGRIEGYKGDQTIFEIEKGDSPEIRTDQNAVACSRIDWAKELERLIPKGDEITWQDGWDCTWASALVSVDVLVVGLKKK